MISYIFPREEHLKSRKLIRALFHHGKAFSVYPIKVCYLLSPSDSAPPARAGFSVPTRNFKKAVHRNRIKRQMREVYRLQKQDLSDLLRKKELNIAVFFIYIDRKLPDYALLSEKMGVSLNLLVKALKKEPPNE